LSLLALRFAAERPQKIICIDIDITGAQAVMSDVAGIAYQIDVANEAEIVGLINHVEAKIGLIVLFECRYLYQWWRRVAQ
jgi:hypothetical protein